MQRDTRIPSSTQGRRRCSSKANVIIVTGTPGTGKTAFSRMLAKQLQAHYLSLGDYIAQHRLYARIDRRSRSRIVDISKTGRTVRSLIAENPCLVVDTHMPEGIIPDHATKMVFVLRCNPKVLERRLRGRKWESRKVRENVMAEILDSCLIAAQNNYAKQKITQLDTSHASIRNSVLLARRILLGARPPKSPIDWLGRLEKDNSFSKYLRW